jgi:hypothetical protein
MLQNSVEFYQILLNCLQNFVKYLLNLGGWVENGPFKAPLS